MHKRKSPGVRLQEWLETGASACRCTTWVHRRAEQLVRLLRGQGDWIPGWPLVTWWALLALLWVFSSLLTACI